MAFDVKAQLAKLEAAKKAALANLQPAIDAKQTLSFSPVSGSGLANMTPEDKAALNKNVLSTYDPDQLAAIKERDAKAAADKATNDRFGNDMAWLDSEFQEDPALLGKSERSQVYADPNMVDSQQKALDSLFGIAKDGGATAQERSRRAGARADSEGWLRGQREADMQNLSERGMSGSGSELLTLAKDRQDAASRLSKADLDTDAWLEQRALDATMKGGELAGQMRDTGFNEGQTRAGAQDEFYTLNQDSLNAAEAANTKFKQEAWNDTIRRRNDWDMKKLELGLDTANQVMDSDVGQGKAGFDYSGKIASQDAAADNAMKGTYNGYLGAPNTAMNEATKDADKAWGEIPGTTGKAMDDWGSTIAGAAGGGGGGGGMASTAGLGGSGGGAGGSSPIGGVDDPEKYKGYA